MFDPARHHPLRYDITGMPKKQTVNPRQTDDRNILKEKISKCHIFLNPAEVPDWWSPMIDMSAAGKSTEGFERRTKTVMMAERKKARVPDISYDLDRDGVINNRDYFIAKFFDKDKDGKLNQEEYQAAIKALEEGFE